MIAASWRTLAIQRGLVLQGRRLYTTRTSAVVEESAFLFDAVVWSVSLRSDDVGGMRESIRIYNPQLLEPKARSTTLSGVREDLRHNLVSLRDASSSS